MQSRPAQGIVCPECGELMSLKTTDTGTGVCSYSDKNGHVFKTEPKEPEELFWQKKTTFSCPDCGYVMTDYDHQHQIKREMSFVHEIEMDFFTCPECGKKAIVLW